MTGVLIGAVVGWVSAPGEAARTGGFEATHIMILDPSASDRTLINRAAVLATLGAVPDRVGARLGIEPRSVRSMVSAGTRDRVSQLTITGRSVDRARAEALADVTAEELIAELGGAEAPLRTLETAVATPVESDEIVGPRSKPGRAVILGGFGLLLGIGAAFAVSRIDNSIRSKPGAEAALGVGVVADVPPIGRSDRDRLVGPSEAPSFIEAYRALRTNVDRWAGRVGDGPGGRVVVVTSPSAGEGKTVTVAHLAAALAEIGRPVLAISADLRRPKLHLYFDRPRDPGLADVLRGAPDTRQLTDLKLMTSISGLSLVPSGAPVDNPSPLLERIGEHLDAARVLAEVVLVDAPPLLTAAEAADLALHADGVLVVVRAGHTSRGAAARSTELLQRLGVPIIGAVLVGSDKPGART